MHSACFVELILQARSFALFQQMQQADYTIAIKATLASAKWAVKNCLQHWEPGARQVKVNLFDKEQQLPK